MRVLVTGASGFVGGHLLAALRSNGGEVIAAGGLHDGDPFVPLDITDLESVRRVVSDARPDAIVHLAGQAFVPRSIAAPLDTFAVNATGTAYLLEAVRRCRDGGGRAITTLIVGSADVYGAQPPERMPLDELTPLNPANPYAASKIAAEMYARSYARAYDLPIVVARAFNHIGPGQAANFAVASFARQLAEIDAGAPAEMLVGNLEARRDFLDVRDVVRAYLALLANGGSGEVYNVCSGHAVALREVLHQLIEIARVAVEVRDDPNRMRPSDTPMLAGNPAKLRAATGWEPQHALGASLRDIYDDARERVAAGRA